MLWEAMLCYDNIPTLICSMYCTELHVLKYRAVKNKKILSTLFKSISSIEVGCIVIAMIHMFPTLRSFGAVIFHLTSQNLELHI
jgi:hypothetical protein